MSKSTCKNRAQWAAEISAAHKQSVEGILKMGRALIAAKKELEHGTFQNMIENDLPFDASTAQRLMKIARDPRIRNAARVQLLPMAWGTLYELTKLPDVAFKQAVSLGAIHPQMTREEAKSVRVKVEHRDVLVAAPYYKTANAEPAKVVKPVIKADDRAAARRRVTFDTRPDPMDLPPPDVWLILKQIEQLVGDLARVVESGDFQADAIFKGRIRAVSDRLLTLNTDDEYKSLH